MQMKIKIENAKTNTSTNANTDTNTNMNTNINTNTNTNIDTHTNENTNTNENGLPPLPVEAKKLLTLCSFPTNTWLDPSQLVCLGLTGANTKYHLTLPPLHGCAQ